MKLAITIDTEEDNWGSYNTTQYTTKNIERISKLQEVFDQFNVVPTYLVTYPVATDPKSVRILRKIYDEGKCEIGMHCHPWNTPPFEEERNEYNSMLSNLPAGLQYKKMLTLHETINGNFGIEPKSFRAGRWGYNQSVGDVLKELNYKVDTSITPFTNWSEYCGPDFSNMFPDPYKLYPNGGSDSDKHNLIEIPATIGYLQKNFALCNSIDQRLNSNWSKRFHVKGILRRLRLINKVYLSTESASSNQMISLTGVFMKRKAKIINMFFHSTSLMAGLSSFVQTLSDERKFLDEIRFFLSFVCEAGITGVKLSDVSMDLFKTMNGFPS